MDHVSFFSEATLIEIGVYISSTVSLTNSKSVWGKLYWDLFFKFNYLPHTPCWWQYTCWFLANVEFLKKKKTS